MAEKYWQRLLTEWRAQGGNGLTIPYLIGSQMYLPASHENQGIGELLTDIVNSDGIAIYVIYCPNIKEKILGLRDITKENIAGHFPPFENRPQSKLFLTKFLGSLGNDVITIRDSLVDEFQKRIDSNTFSVNDCEWGGFTANESKFIKDCFSIYT